MAVVSLSEFRDRRQSVFFKAVKNTFPLNNFNTHLVAVRGLGKTTAGTYCRAVAVILGRLDSDAPPEKELLQYVANMRDRYSYKHIVNSQRAIEEYTAYLGRPLRFTRPRKPKQDIGEVLTEAEVAVILAVGCADIREKAMIALLAYSGIRNNEFCNLKVSDIDFANNQVVIRQGKGSKDGRANITGECIEILMLYLQEFPRPDDDFLFTTLRHGHQYGPASLRKIVRKIAKRAGIAKRTHPHIFRHSLAVNMLIRGASVWDIQAQLRHDDVLTTISIYLRSYRPDARVNYLKYRPCYI